jgi:type VI secretion system secreted protein Hcp
MALVDYFLKLDGIKGESADAKHKDELDIESFSWGLTHPTGGAAGGGAGAGKVSMQDFHFVMRLNRASPELMKACATGQHIKLGTLTCRKAGKDQQEFLTIKFSDVLVSSYQTGGSESSDIVPTDQISLNFAKVEIEYKQQKPDGRLAPGGQFGFDIKANKAL